MTPHLALARKWRPQQFEDVIGQRGVVETLKNAITAGRLAQSFIFSGPRGVGKTTTARILARALNCVKGPTPEPCGVCDACVEIAESRDVDVFEIDGATYTGVDAVREVIVEPIAVAPMRDRFKIFIIDEVHRLSKNAFDALLKTIEEPPPHVKFLMATTDLQAVPATIQSRSQIFELKSLSFAAIRELLRTVAATEGAAVDEAALTLLARAAEGSMRDGLGALDQVIGLAGDNVTTADVSTVLGIIGRDMQIEIVRTIAREDPAAIFALAGSIVEAGLDLRIVCRELTRFMRDLMLVKIDPSRLEDPEIAGEGEREPLVELAGQFSREDILRSFDLLSRAEFEIRGSTQPRYHFEMALLKWIHLRQLTPLADVIARLESGAGATGVRLDTPSPRPHAVPAPSRAQTPGPRPVGPGAARPGPAAVKPPAAPQTPPPKAEAAAAEAAPTDLKGSLLAAIRGADKNFYGFVVAPAQQIEVAGDEMIFMFTAAQKWPRAQLESKRQWVEQLARSTAGRPIRVVVKESAAAEQPAAARPAAAAAAPESDLKTRAKADPAVQSMLEVFGAEIEGVEEID